jgi:hypothetical protein
MDLGTIFTKLQFLCNGRMSLIRYSATIHCWKGLPLTNTLAYCTHSSDKKKGRVVNPGSRTEAEVTEKMQARSKKTGSAKSKFNTKT